MNVNKKFFDLIDLGRKDIWRYARLLGKQGKTNLIDPQQKDFTPIEKVGNWLVKREDKSAVGSHKFRALAYQLDYLLDHKIKAAVLSSSGNAAIAASRILSKNANLKLFVFLSRKTPPGKLAALRFSKNLIPILSERPLRMAKYLSKRFGLRDLRPSQDQNAITGFRSLGFEIFEQKPDIENIFSFATSFASVRGIAEAFEFLVKIGARQKMPKIFAVTSSGRLAGELSGQVAKSAEAYEAKAEQRVDTSRQNNFVEWTGVDSDPAARRMGRQTASAGNYLVSISAEELALTRKIYPDLKTSQEGWMSLAAAEKVQPRGESLVVLTGRDWPSAKVDFSKFETADKFTEADKMVARHA
ncbi:MAG: PLP-dependent lyase/thiolase [Patescibacteria group bacterium]